MKNEMKSNIKKIYTAHYVFLLATYLFSYIFFAFILDMVFPQAKKEKNYPGIDIKEFR